MTRHFDAIVIGAGQAGPFLAARLVAAGQNVAVVERKFIGGTCVNAGCMPTKTLVASARAAHVARRASDYGVLLGGELGIDMTKVKARADTVVKNARDGVESWLRDMKGCTLIEGHGRFEGPDRVRVGDELLTAPRVFINVGGRPFVPDLPGIDQVRYLTSTTILALERVPEHLIVVGGSYIGLEFAQMYRRFGARVSVIEKGPRLVAHEDEDISEAVRGILESEGISVRTNSTCIRFAPHPEGVTVGMQCDGEPELTGSDVLLAVGRKPNTHDLGLGEAGVELDARGYIRVDDQLATNVPGIWALGDCNGRGAFTHTSYNDFEIVAANLLDGEKRRLSDRVRGYALYIDPPLGRAGMSESEAKKSGRPLLVGRRPMSRVGRAIEKGETQGLMKIVADAETHRILGAAILGTGGDEAVHGVLDVMTAGLPYSELRWSVGIHPTVSELWPTLLTELRPVP